jgi:hypothetical protein
MGGERKRTKGPKIVFENREGIREGAHGVFNFYIPTTKEVRKAYKPEERIQHRSKSQFNYNMEESMYKDCIPRKTFVQVSITFFLKLRIEHGSRHWKGIE